MGDDHDGHLAPRFVDGRHDLRLRKRIELTRFATNLIQRKGIGQPWEVRQAQFLKESRLR